jgi:NTP pyrophosphatase (non-canonical NTP hydrolase)
MNDKKRYYVYHIPGRKIGMTNNIEKRVIKEQGYHRGEFEILISTGSMKIASEFEKEYQKKYDYAVDRQTYQQLMSLKPKENTKKYKMKLNATEQTTTFPVPLNKLKGNLMDNIGMQWDTDHGVFVLDSVTIPWIIKNAKVSMYNEKRCYIYNKAYAMAHIPTPGNPISTEYDHYESNCKLAYDYKPTVSNEEEAQMPVKATYKYISAMHPQTFNDSFSVYDNIRTWANDKGIYDKGDSKTQYLKLMEEAGELAEAILKEDQPEIIDAIGDMVVVLTNLARMEGHKIEDCVTSAYNVIKERTGQMINGTFVKNETL